MIMHFIQSGFLATLLFAAFIALLSVPGYRKARDHLVLLPCRFRSKILTVWLFSPLLIGGLLTVFGLLPSWMDSHEQATEHCASHANGVAHLCWFDPIVHLSDMLWNCGAIVLALTILFNAGKGSVLLLRHWRFQKTLQGISERDPNHAVFRIASERNFVFSAGIMTPRIYISSRLMKVLSGQQLAVVLAHEQAHCLRRDVLRRLLLSVVGLFHFPGTRRHLLNDLELAHEQICDAAAVQKVGDRLLVAEAIIQTTRQINTFRTEQETGLIAFHGSHIDIRIQQLLKQPRMLSGNAMFLSGVLFSLVLLGMVTLTMPLHHLH